MAGMNSAFQKRSGLGQLIDMHVRRGDAIFFVTGRSPTKTETVSKTLADNFHIPATNMNPVIFAGDKPGQNTKSQWLQDKNIRIFYGDSDNDITAARDVGARGIRILRASNSTYKPLPQAGAFGEEVIVNSEYWTERESVILSRMLFF